MGLESRIFLRCVWVNSESLAKKKKKIKREDKKFVLCNSLCHNQYRYVVLFVINSWDCDFLAMILKHGLL